MKKIVRQTSRRRNQHGSALLVSLMVMVGLSLLGLGFVAITQTENTISANERNYAQVLSVAEAGSRLCLEWFQDPTWARTNNLMPLNENVRKTLRTLGAGAYASGGYSGYYKSGDSTNVPYGNLCDKPFKAAARDRFLGTENTPDVIIDMTTSASFLTDYFNPAIAADPNDGQVTEIRIYSPPIVDGQLNASGFWEGGTRYGLCTIKVTAQKRIGSTIVAQRSVKTVISEWPFPGPQGPVQSNANISTGGNFGVHWGKMTSEKDMDIKSPWVGLPWHDAYDRIHFDRGYFQPGQNALGVANDASICDGQNWLYAVYGLSFEDPWFEARAKGVIQNTVAGAAFEPFQVTSFTQNLLNTPDYGWSNWFQKQDNDSTNTTCGTKMTKTVIFPKIDYEFWKNLSRSSTSTNSSVHYLSWVSGENYTDGVSIKNAAQWINTARPVNPAKPGFYFFDTKNSLNPQGTAAPGVLTPDIKINSSDDGSTFKMQGFVYFNTQTYGTQGIGGPHAYYNFPGEPYRDIGYWKVNCTTPGNPATCTLASPAALVNTPGEFDWADLNGNGVLDIYVATQSITKPSGSSNEYLPVPWSVGCTPGFNGASGANCSEPHEPFLNLIYPATAANSSGGPPTAVQVGWQAPNNYTKRSKVKDSTTGNPISCLNGLQAPGPPILKTAMPGPQILDVRCTSNGWDKDGPLVYDFRPTGGNAQAILDGVLYNEGGFDSSGNGAYFGSVLINGNIGGTGTAEVWFDEYLVKGGWQDKFKDLPRVFVTAHETDQ